MALARGPAADYDEWAKLTGDSGWKWDNVLPLMKEVRYASIQLAEEHVAHTHG